MEPWGDDGPVTSEPGVVLRGVVDGVRAVLGDDLEGVVVAGSYVLGDFAPQRSDLDLLAVLRTEPSPETVAALEPVHAALDAAFPDWAGRIEVEYVTAQAVAEIHDVHHMIMRVSPGEPLHLLPATVHRLVGWYLARRHGVAICGPIPEELLPAVSDEAFRAGVLAHLTEWPVWVRVMTGTGGQVYAVLSVCRGVALLLHGAQVSKRRAAVIIAGELPSWAELVQWAARWWYEGGRDDEPSRLPEVASFVEEMSILAARHGPRGDAGPPRVDPVARLLPVDAAPLLDRLVQRGVLSKPRRPDRPAARGAARLHATGPVADLVSEQRG